MNIAFAKKWPKKMGYLSGDPTNFVEKILSGLQLKEVQDFYKSKYGLNFLGDPDGIVKLFREKANYNLDYDMIGVCDSKIHTIRLDEKKRWKEGMKIHMIINNRTKFRFQFAPTMEVKSIQTLEVVPKKLYGMARLAGLISIDNHPIRRHSIVREFCLNDGFAYVCEFQKWFNEPLKASLIHWTEKKYGL